MSLLLEQFEEVNKQLNSTLCQMKRKKVNKTLNSFKIDLKIEVEDMKQNINHFFNVSKLLTAKKDMYTEMFMLSDKISQIRKDIKTEKLKLKKLNKKLNILQAKSNISSKERKQIESLQIQLNVVERMLRHEVEDKSIFYVLSSLFSYISFFSLLFSFAR